jgi:hypothetical protein
MIVIPSFFVAMFPPVAKIAMTYWIRIGINSVTEGTQEFFSGMQDIA